MPIPRSTVGTYFSGPVAMASSRETFGIRGKSKSTFASDGKELLFFWVKTVCDPSHCNTIELREVPDENLHSPSNARKSIMAKGNDFGYGKSGERFWIIRSQVLPSGWMQFRD
jgi:hypothetical protein